MYVCINCRCFHGTYDVCIKYRCFHGKYVCTNCRRFHGEYVCTNCRCFHGKYVCTNCRRFHGKYVCTNSLQTALLLSPVIPNTAPCTDRQNSVRLVQQPNWTTRLTHSGRGRRRHHHCTQVQQLCIIQPSSHQPKPAGPRPLPTHLCAPRTRTNPLSLAVLITGSDSPSCDSLLRLSLIHI